MAKGELPVHKKHSHADAEYVRPSPHLSKSCGECDMLIDALEPRCQIVASPIYLNGLCKYFEPIR